MGTPLRRIWTECGLPEHLLEHLNLTGKADPVVNSSFKLGTVAQTSIAVSGLSAAYFHQLNAGGTQTITVDSRHAVLEFRSQSYWLVNGRKPAGDLFDNLAGLYRTRDGFVRIHTNFPHHKQGILGLLRCEPTRESIQLALLQWEAQEFEDQAVARKLCVTKARTFQEWDNHPHAIAMSATPPVEIIRVGEAPKRPTNPSKSNPLGGIRVLDLTRVLAGPVAGRTLAAHGADVLLITAPQLPGLPLLDCDTSRGKRTTQLNLNESTDRETLRKLVVEADVFLQAYRPGGLHEKGFGVNELIKARPGLVYASLNAYGWSGPWKDRRGFDSLVQNATGFGYSEAEASQQSQEGNNSEFVPQPLPCQAIDHAAGYLLAFGINTALCKTIMEGGSWEVRVSLAGVAQWIRSLGQLEKRDVFGKDLALPSGTLPWPEELVSRTIQLRQSRMDGTTIEDVAELATMTAIAHAAKLSLTPVREGDAPLRLDAHEARWLDRNWK